MGRNKHQEMGQQLMGPLEPIEIKLRGTPGGPVVKTWPSNARGVDSIPSQRAAIRHASWPKKKQNIKKKKKKQRNEAEKHKHLSKGNFDIQVRSFRPTSCFFKHSLLVPFRGTKVQSETMLWKITQPTAISQYNFARK